MNPINLDAAQAITRARSVLILDQPFFGALALRLQPVEEPGIPTAAVDGRRLFYNPDFFLAQNDKLRLSVMAHEVMHCVLDHIGRVGGRNHAKWGHACDYAVNLLLQEAGFEIGEGWLLEPKYKDMSAEHIYNLLPDDLTASGGPLDDLRAPPKDEGNSSEAALGELQRDWTVATIGAALASQGCGKLPASLERLIRERTDPQVDWRTVLRRFVTERTRDDYSWSRPNKHMLVYNVYLPSLYSESVGHLAVAIDTSGSIDGPTLASFAAEVDAVIAAVRPRKVTVLYCDAQVAGVDCFEQGQPFVINARGGGGTAFQPVFDRLEQDGSEPPCALLYLTDLYGPTNFAAPPYPVLWVCTNEQVGPWGETVQIKI